MVVRHIVICNIKDSRGLYELTQLKGRIDGLISVEMGVQESKLHENYEDRSQGYNALLVMSFKDGAALSRYQKDAEHQRIRDTLIKPQCNVPVLVLDYFANDDVQFCDRDWKNSESSGSLNKCAWKTGLPWLLGGFTIGGGLALAALTLLGKK